MRYLAIAGMCALVLSGSLSVTAQSKSKAKVSSLKQKLSSVDSKQKQLLGKLKQKKGEIKVATVEMQTVDSKLDRIAQRLDDTRDQLEASKRRQIELAQHLDVAREKVSATRENASERIRAMYMQGDEPLLAMLIRSKGIEDFAERKVLLERIAARDRSMFQEYRALMADIEAKKREQDRVVQKVQELESSQRTQKVELADVLDEKQQALNMLSQEKSALQKAYDELEAESNYLERQIRSYQSSNTGGVVFRGGMIMPTNGRFSSGFGMRRHPILGYSRMHTGQDIGAKHGTPIVAAAPGKVISASYSRGYGNMVVIDHGGGVSTLYGHCSRLFVKRGENVKQGQKIAAVGSTGLSTGPHLHFEVRIKGKPVNPRSRI